VFTRSVYRCFTDSLGMLSISEDQRKQWEQIQPAALTDLRSAFVYFSSARISAISESKYNPQLSLICAELFYTFISAKISAIGGNKYNPQISLIYAELL